MKIILQNVSFPENERDGHHVSIIDILGKASKKKCFMLMKRMEFILAHVYATNLETYTNMACLEKRLLVIMKRHSHYIWGVTSDAVGVYSKFFNTSNGKWSYFTQ